MTYGKALIDRRALLATSAALTLGMAPAPPRRAITRQANAESTVLVRGEIELPADALMTWRVVHDVAETSSNAAFETRATGFAIATSPFTSLLLTDEVAGSAYRLAPGEAAFAPASISQRRESLGKRRRATCALGWWRKRR